VLVALTSAQKGALAGMGAAFIIFALISSMVIPRYRPEWPGRVFGVFLGLVGVFTVAMLLTVFFVARESEAEAHGGTTEGSTGAAETQPRPPAPAAGNAAAGKALFTSQGCAACHTFKPAGSTGTTGPDLDKLAADAQKANQGPLPQYVLTSITDPGAYVVPGYPGGVMPTDFAKLPKKQLADLVAFLTQSS
jgi:mono/diheme cytochrome c family protein